MGAPKVRNLELGNKVSVHDPEQHLASKSAHASAKIMEPAPQGADATAVGGCCSTCTVG